MTCSWCGGNTTVVNSGKDCEKVARKRKCNDCGMFLYTVEEETAEAETIVKQMIREKWRRQQNKKEKAT